jgi:EmrB/QacA subfamily drug resistance transporter
MALILLTAVELVVFLDVSIVNIALPSIGKALLLSDAGLAWVVNAYQVTFGGFQLIGGRAADLLGRRRTFQVGLGVFTVASLLAGIAPWAWLLVVARAVQGIGAAIVVPAELSLLSVTFTEPAAYQRAFGVWSAMGAAGAASGVALGGILTQQAGWPWIFWVNVPIGIVALVLSSRYLPADRVGVRPRQRLARNLDLAGAATGTAGLLLLVYGISAVSGQGWDTSATIAFVFAPVLLVAFVVVEHRAAQPLLPLRLFRIRNVSASAAANFLVGAAHVPAFVFLSLYFQNILGFSAIVAGFAVLPIALINVAVSRTLLPRALSRWGPRVLLAGGFALLLVGLAGFGRAPAGGSYLVDVLPAAILFAVGLPCVFVGSTLPAVKSVAEFDTGVVGGVVNTAQRVGSSLGVGVLLALASWHTSHAGGPGGVARLNAGYQWGFWGTAALAGVGVIVAAVGLTRIPAAAGDAASAGVPSAAVGDG